MKKLLTLIGTVILCLSLLFNTGCSIPDVDTPGVEPPIVSPPSGEGPSGDNPENGGTGDGPSATCIHKDGDDNGNCDECGISVIITIDFYAINDLHGKFSDTASQPGVDELSTYLGIANASDDHTVFLSSGDMWQGSSESNLTGGRIITDWMGELGFVSMTLGNHEFDWGEEVIEDNLEIADFPFLAINIYERDTDTLADYCTPSLMIERGGIKVGIIGAIGDCYSSISPDKCEDVYFKVGSELTELVKKESQRLRDEGAEYIVYSLHGGYGKSISGTSTITTNELKSYYDASLSDGYVDLVFEGHTHKNYVLKDIYGVYHLQNGGDNKGISHVEVSINYVNDTSVINEAEFVEKYEYTSLEDDDIVEELLEKYADVISKGHEVLGTNSRYRSSDELCTLAAQMYYEFGVNEWGDEYDITLGGGFFQARSPYNLSAGEVKYSDLQMIFPFDNPLTLCSIKGSYLKSKFINTNNGNYFIYSDQPISSNDIVDSATYYVIVDSYTAYYAPNRLTVIETYDATLYARDLIAEYIKNGGFE